MRILPALLLICASPLLAEPIVIGHPGMPPLDRTTLQRIYTGKVVEVNGARVTPLNLPPGNAVRARFLSLYLHQNDEDYIGYWTVRRYVGKGTPPRELDSADAVVRFVSKTTGAIGYVDEHDMTAGVDVLNKAP
jgi:ABC-type phosphate transport system substrate-binding protein